MTILWSNNAATTLAGPISNSATSVNVAAGTGALFPSPAGGNYFTLTFVDAATGLLNEITHCTARTGDTMTIVRAEEGTTALSWLAGDLANNFITAGTMAALEAFPIGGAFPQTYNTLTASATVTSAYNGQFINVGGSSITLTLQPASTLPGMSVGFFAVNPFTLIDTAGEGGIVGGISGGVVQNSISFSKGDFLCLESDGYTWRAFSVSPDFWMPGNINPTGHTYLPNGLLVNWGQATCPPGTPPLSATANFDQAYASWVKVTLGGVTTLPVGISYDGLTLAGMTVWTAGGGGEMITYIAIGV